LDFPQTRRGRPRKYIRELVAERRTGLTAIFEHLLGKAGTTLLLSETSEIAQALGSDPWSEFSQREDQCAEWIKEAVLDPNFPTRKPKSQAKFLADWIIAKDARTSLRYFRRAMRRAEKSAAK
jgi:hypothetical protein